MGRKISIFVKLALIAVAVFLIISIFRMNIRINECKYDYNILKDELQEARLNIEDLTEQLQSPINEDSIKRIAKEKLNLREPDEQIFASDYRK